MFIPGKGKAVASQMCDPHGDTKAQVPPPPRVGGLFRIKRSAKWGQIILDNTAKPPGSFLNERQRQVELHV